MGGLFAKSTDEIVPVLLKQETGSVGGLVVSQSELMGKMCWVQILIHPKFYQETLPV